MKRTCLISCALGAAILAPMTASADDEPGILYIPTEPVTLQPTGMAPCGADVNSALGCGGATEMVEEAPFGDAAGLTASLAEELAPYDVMVTNERPPEYVSYLMMLPSEEPSEMSTSFTCTFGRTNCASRNRNDIVSTSGSTMNCLDPETLHAAVFAFGRASGLEGIANPDDWMNYELGMGALAGPDYATPPVGFIDSCSDRVPPQGFNDQMMQVSLPLACTSVDHVMCDAPGGMQGQNSHQDLLLYYGERTDDADPPELSNIVPEDGAMLAEGDDLVLDVDITDADPAVGVRWTISSDAIISDPFPDGILDQCTNDVCSSNWNDALPLKATDSDWAVTLEGLPAGSYAITLEAADYHGNVAEMVSFSITIGPSEGEDSSGGGMMDTGNASASASASNTNGNMEEGGFTSGEDDTGSGGGTGQDVDDSSGCSCRTAPSRGGGVLMLLGLMGLGVMRRRS